MKRFILVVTLAAAIPLIGPFSIAADKAPSSEVGTQLAQARGGQACMDRCERAKNECMAYYTKSDSTSGRYVTADGARTCWASYHQCKRECPR